MKDKKNLTNREKMALLKKKENATFIAGMVFVGTMVASIPLTFVGMLPFDKKIDNILTETGYNEYVDEKLGEYEEQYNNNEIPKEVYESYKEYYGRLPASKEYFDSIGDTETYNKLEGLLKGRQACGLSIISVGLVSAFAGLYCIMSSKFKAAEMESLAEEMKEAGELFEDDEENNLPPVEDIFPEFGKKDDEEERG